ncbi:MAG: DegT/DnrJ/EryC1/StrS family aminotransferase [Deltaproteobacteria bacterium]|jgi:dTDP-4-amino-4,6-dideoxygalactose transaminase|nr:DegT/DnrJ/EryC1/StrS family aminotransferase [Deltaproteobacteria bacterium]
MTASIKVPKFIIPFDEEDSKLISASLREMLLKGRLAMGPAVLEFEELFQDFCRVSYAVGCGSGTAALELIFRALDLPGGSVAVPANTFLATALAPVAAGHKIIFVDCDRHHFQMCPDDLARRIRPDTRAVVLVHLGGMISKHWRKIEEISMRNGAVLIEDAAHAHGAETEGAKAGSLGRAGAFSFYPTKVLTTAEGGMVTTFDKALAQRMRAVRNHGQARPGSNAHEVFGLNYRPSEIHALLGLRMMAKAESILSRRREAASVYDRLLAKSAVTPVLPPQGQKPSYYKYMALLPEGADRSGLKRLLLTEYGVDLPGEVYANPAHLQPLWASRPEFLASPLEELPVTEMVSRRQVCLPIFPEITAEQQELVAESLSAALGRL